MVEPERLSNRHAAALEKSYRASGFDEVFPCDLKFYFVDQLPYQPWGNYVAKVWGEDAIYISTKATKVDTLAKLMATYNGRKLICHEGIHQDQVGRWGWNGFMFRYISGFIGAGFSYRRNYLEKEAYDNEQRVVDGWDARMVF